MKKLVTIDIGGTFIKYGIMDETETISETNKIPTEAFLGGPQILQKVENIIANFSQKDELLGVAISSAGMIDSDRGEVFYSGPTIPNYIGTNYKKAIAEKFQLPCEVENDVNCAGLAESVSGSGKYSHSSLCLTIGTGIGGCFIYENKVFHGFSNSACEVGYMHQDNSDYQTLGATSTLVKRVAERKKEDVSLWNGEKIFNLAKKDDIICQEEIVAMCDAISKGLSNICYVLNPQTIILGGGVMAQKDYLHPILLDKLRKYLVPSIFEKTTLTYATHENAAGMLGAYYHYKQRHENMWNN